MGRRHLPVHRLEDELTPRPRAALGTLLLLAACSQDPPPPPEGCTAASLEVDSLSAAASDNDIRSLVTMTVIGHPVGTKRPPGDGSWNKHQLTFEWYNYDVHAWETGPYDASLDLDAVQNLDPGQFDPLVKLNPPCEPGPGNCPVLGPTSGTEQLQDRAAKVRAELGGPAGRPPLPRFQKTIHSFRKIVADPEEAFGDLDALDTMEPEDATALFQTLSALQLQLDAIVKRLRGRVTALDED